MDYDISQIEFISLMN